MDEVLTQLSVWNEVLIQRLFARGLAIATAVTKTPSSLDSLKSRMVLPVWYHCTPCCPAKKAVHWDAIKRVYKQFLLCIHGTSHRPVSVRVCLCLCLSVTSRSSTKMAKRRITQTTPHDTPGTLVFWCQRSPRNSTGVTPYGGTKCRWGGSKSATFHK